MVQAYSIHAPDSMFMRPVLRPTIFRKTTPPRVAALESGYAAGPGSEVPMTTGCSSPCRADHVGVAFVWLLTACATSVEVPAPVPAADPSSEAPVVPEPLPAAALKGTVEGARSTHVMDARVRAMPPGSPTTGAFFILHNPSEYDAVVVGGSSPSARAVELHTHIEEGGQFKMRQVDRIEVPAGQQVQLEPGGLHVMLIDLTAPLTIGDTVALTLDFESGHTETFEIPVQQIAAPGTHNHAGQGAHGDEGAHAHH